MIYILELLQFVENRCSFRFEIQIYPSSKVEEFITVNKYMFSEISQNSQENTCARFSF